MENNILILLRLRCYINHVLTYLLTINACNLCRMTHYQLAAMFYCSAWLMDASCGKVYMTSIILSDG